MLALLVLYVLCLQIMVCVALIKTDLLERSSRKLLVLAQSTKLGAPLRVPAAVATEPVQPVPAPSANVATQDPEKELSAIVGRDLFVYPLSTQLALRDLIPGDPIFFVGDSLIRGLNVHAVSSMAVNFGIPGDNTAGVGYRIKKYSKMIPQFDAAKTIVLAVGINNLGIGVHADSLIGRHIQQILANRPVGQHILLNAIFPVDEGINSTEFTGFNKRIIVINKNLKVICSRSPNCTFLNAGKGMIGKDGNLLKKYHNNKDAIHLSPLAYSVWEDELRLSLPN